MSAAAFDIHRITADRFEAMVAAGIYGPSDAIELLDGRIVDVPPQGPAHSRTVTRLARTLRRALGDEVWVLEEKPIRAGDYALPEPDLALVPDPLPEDRHPRADETRLIVEIALTSQRLDARKAVVYAEAGAPVYWLVDLVARQVTVHEGPMGQRWQSVRVLEERDRVRLPGGPELEVGSLLA